jgi:Protein tyrosine and serine/threonine kinase
MQAKCVDCLVDVAKGMEYIQSRNIIHGDLNPSNILLRYPQAPAATAYASSPPSSAARSRGTEGSSRSHTASAPSSAAALRSPAKRPPSGRTAAKTLAGRSTLSRMRRTQTTPPPGSTDSHVSTGTFLRGQMPDSVACASGSAATAAADTADTAANAHAADADEDAHAEEDAHAADEAAAAAPQEEGLFFDARSHATEAGALSKSQHSVGALPSDADAPPNGDTALRAAGAVAEGARADCSSCDSEALGAAAAAAEAAGGPGSHAAETSADASDGPGSHAAETAANAAGGAGSHAAEDAGDAAASAPTPQEPATASSKPRRGYSNRPPGSGACSSCMHCNRTRDGCLSLQAALHVPCMPCRAHSLTRAVFPFACRALGRFTSLLPHRILLANVLRVGPRPLGPHRKGVGLWAVGEDGP